MLLTMLLPVTLGALLWTLAEYLLHRLAGHGRVERQGRFWWATWRVGFIVFREEHVAHHRNPSYFAPTTKKAGAAALLVPVVGGLAALVAGAATGLAFGAGFAGAYAAYEVLHRRIHTHAPMGRYFAWMRRHHLHHHVAPAINFGVTSAAWDALFGTRVEVHPVKLPRSLAPSWLLDPATGATRTEFAREYELVGR